MKKASFIVIFITTATENEAKKIADALVTHKKSVSNTLHYIRFGRIQVWKYG